MIIKYLKLLKENQLRIWIFLKHREQTKIGMNDENYKNGICNYFI